MKMEAIPSSETLVTSYRGTRGDDTEVRNSYFCFFSVIFFLEENKQAYDIVLRKNKNTNMAGGLK
jgi:hypothetical protein